MRYGYSFHIKTVRESNRRINRRGKRNKIKRNKMSDEESYIINRLHERFGGGMDKEHFTFLFYFISLMASLTALIITIKFIQ